MSGSPMLPHATEGTGQGRYPNETMRLLFERASCRNFEQRSIPPEVLRLVLEAGLHAPTGGNLQPYSIVQIEEEGTRQWLADKCEQDFVGKAPVLLIFCIDLHRLERWAGLEAAPFTARHSFRHFWISFQDTVICAQNICTAADAMGLASVYIGTISEFFPELRERLALPSGVFPVVLLCLGCPRSTPHPRRKLGVEVIVHSERYRELADQVLLDAFDEKYSHARIEATPERLEEIARVARTVHGEEFARKCLARIREKGHINIAQRYFGLHYHADDMPAGNDTYLETLKDSGFDWFEPYEPPLEP